MILEAIIDPQGNVTNVRVLRSIPLLDQSAIDAVKQWKYEPTLLNGVPFHRDDRDGEFSVELIGVE